MRFIPGDKFKIVCHAVGEVLHDPVSSQFTLLVKINGHTYRIPNDGGIAGIRELKLIRVEEEDAHERC